MEPKFGPIPDYGDISEWRTYVSNEHLLTFKYPRDYNVYADNENGIWVGSGTGDLNIYFKSQNRNLENPQFCQNYPVKNGNQIYFCTYHNPTQPADNEGTVMEGIYNLNAGKTYEFYISLSPPPYRDTGLKMFSQLLSTFEFVPESATVDQEGFKSYNGTSSAGRQPFTFKYPENYVLAFETGNYNLTSKNNPQYIITITGDDLNLPESYESILNKIRQEKNYSALEEFANGVLLSGVRGMCSPQSGKCYYKSEIIVKYGAAAQTLEMTSESLKSDALLIAKSIRDIE